MSLAMASSGTTLGFCSNLKVIEKQPAARLAPFRCFVGLNPVQGFCIFSKQRSFLFPFECLFFTFELFFLFFPSRFT